MSNFHTRHQFITCETDRPTISRSVIIPSHTYYKRLRNMKKMSILHFVIMEAAIQVTQSLNGKYFPKYTPGKKSILVVISMTAYLHSSGQNTVANS